MTLQTQLIPLVMDKGMNTKTDNKTGVPGELVALTNATFQTPGQTAQQMN